MGHRRRECRDFQIWDGSSSQYGRASSLLTPGLRSDGQLRCAASDSPPQYTDSKFCGARLCSRHTNEEYSAAVVCRSPQA
eukprot:scaffold84768_cov60-Phaeocystis_antarctica.AAC.5